MQTFLPLASYAASLAVLDYRRLGKQRVECKQLLRSMAMDGLLRGWDHMINVDALFPEVDGLKNLVPGKVGWRSHPARKMWEENPDELALYHDLAILEWVRRGYNNSMPLVYKKDTELDNSDSYPRWFGDEAFHASHRSNLLRKDPEYYGQFGWEEPNDLPYIWPEA